MNLIKAARSFSGLTQAQFGEELARMGVLLAGSPLKPVTRHRVCHWERAKRDVPAWAERVAVERLVNQWWEAHRREGNSFWRRRGNEPGDCDFALALQLPELAALYQAKALVSEREAAEIQLHAVLNQAIEAVEDKFASRWQRLLPYVSFLKETR